MQIYITIIVYTNQSLYPFQWTALTKNVCGFLELKEVEVHAQVYVDGFITLLKIGLC